MKRFMYLFSALLFVGLVSQSVSAEDTRFLGQPSFSRGQTRRFVIWEEDDEFRLRTTTKQMLGRFAGAIYAVEGTFADVRVVRRDRGDVVRLSADKKRLYFRFVTRRGVDGLNFRTDAKRLAFDLYINRRRAAKRLEIFLGSEGKHPLHNPFLLFLGGESGDDQVTDIDIDGMKEEGEPVTDVIPENELEDAAKGED